MAGLPKNVWLLTLAQALMMSSSSLVVFSGGLIGVMLAPTEKLATLPIAIFIVGVASASIPMALLMQKIGRRAAFILMSVIAAITALFTMCSIILQSFWLFCTGVFFLGANMAVVQQFRFAAMESVEPEQMPKAASRVLLGGLLAAFLGPEIALLGKDLLAQAYAGSFSLLSILYILSAVLLLGFKNPVLKVDGDPEKGRPLSSIIRQPVFWVAVLAATVAYSIMSFIMTATPVSMHVINEHTLENTKWVIQSHIMAMFIPSIFTAWIIRVIGIAKMMLMGLIAYGVCLVIAFMGQQFLHYWFALVLLGIGWNFLFIGGTSLLPQSYQAAERFKVQATNEFIVYAAQAIASISAGWVIYQLGWHGMLYICIPFILVQVLALAYWRLRSDRELI